MAASMHRIGTHIAANVIHLPRAACSRLLFSYTQLEIIHELSEGMKGCSTAFTAVAAAGIALSVAASSGMELENAPEVGTQGMEAGGPAGGWAVEENDGCFTVNSCGKAAAAVAAAAASTS